MPQVPRLRFLGYVIHSTELLTHCHHNSIWFDRLLCVWKVWGRMSQSYQAQHLNYDLNCDFSLQWIAQWHNWFCVTIFQAPTPNLEILNRRHNMQTRTQSDKKSLYLKTLKRDSPSNGLTNGTGQDDTKVLF